MASPAQRQHPFWDLVRLDYIALGFSAVVLLAAPLSADGWLYERLLGLAASNAPSEKVAVVQVRAAELPSHDCSKSLPELALRARATAGILLEPLAGLCSGAAPTSFRTLDDAALEFGSSGRVVGFSRARDRGRALELLGNRDAEWVASRPWRAVPTLSLEDLVARRIPESLLERRVVVFALEDRARSSAVDDARGPRAAEVGAALAAALEDRPRRELPVLGRLLLGLALAGSIVAARRRQPSRFAPNVVPWAIAGFSSLAALAGAFGFGFLVPLPSLALAVAVFIGVVRFPDALAARRARSAASRLLDEATQAGAHAGRLLPDAEFWSRLARRVEQTHAADGVLVAELPPFSWRLHVWPNGDLNESIIRERRRDVRRTPYVDEAGGRRAKIVDSYVVMNGIPVVFAPLEAAGELEGFLILIGKQAAHAFVERPKATLALADEIAALIRSRRLERLRADEWRRPLGMLVEHPGKWSQDLLEKTRAASENLELVSDVFRASKVGLLYADAFGDVRLLGSSFVELLRPLSVSLPDVGEGPALAPGSLTLSKVLAGLADLARSTPPSLSDATTEGLAFDVPLEGTDGHLRVELKRLETRGELSGYFVTLESVSRTAAPDSKAEPIQRMPERGDPLVVFSLAELVTDVVAAIARDTRLKLQFQTPRVTGHAIGHRRELTDALVKFLLDAAAAQPGSQGPVITLRERRQWVELGIIDLKLGVPEPAMERTVLAPSVPPPGLEPLARFIQAVEDSHGYVRVRGGTTWGVKMMVGLVRAKPRFESSALGRLIRISEAPLGKRK